MYVMLFSFVLFRQVYLFINRQLGNSFLGVTLAYPCLLYTSMTCFWLTSWR